MTNKTAGTYVRVLYDYEYEDSDSNKIIIKEGERFLLLKKANEEWWNVFKMGQSNPFYVPANYVEEIPRTDTPVPDKKEVNSGDALDHYVSGDEEDLCENGNSNPNGQAVKVKQAKDDFYAEPEYENLAAIQSSIQNKSPIQEDDMPTYSNIEELKAILKSKPPKPENGQKPVKALENGWEVYTDLVSERQYYYHPKTMDSTWKPPRGIRSHSLDTEDGSTVKHQMKVSINSFGTKVVLTTSQDAESLQGSGSGLTAHINKLDPKRHSMPVSPSVPPGWTEERTPTGLVCYTNDFSKEKWIQSVDETGRTYFYKDDGSSESSWVLPEGQGRRHGSFDSSMPELEQQHKAFNVKPPCSWRDRLQTPVLPPTIPGSVLSPNKLREDAGEDAGTDEPPKSIPFRLPSIPEPVSDAAGKPRSNDISPVKELPTIKEMNGMLNKTKLMENHKKVKKNWGLSYVTTTGPDLKFYKDQKSAHPKNGQPKPEFTLDLLGAQVDFGNKEVKSSKKNVIQITTTNGMQLLLQSDNNLTIHDWYLALTANVANLNETCQRNQGSLGSLDESPESAGSVNNRSTEEEPSSPQSTLFGRKKAKKLSTLERNVAHFDDPTISREEKSSRIRDKLKMFFSRRPDLGTLQEKGIYKDAVFGSNLSQLCQREKTTVPKFVVQCIATIEKRGLDIDGIFRVSGNLAQIQKVRFMVDCNEKYDLDQLEWDIHVLCGALKLFFRELKEPLVPFQSLTKFLEAIKITDRSAKLRAFKEAIKSLPRPNKETMRELFKHLNKVIEKSKSNRMQTQNIAIVFGPTLMWPEVESHNVAVSMVYQNQIVEYCLLEFKSLFT